MIKNSIRVYVNEFLELLYPENFPIKELKKVVKVLQNARKNHNKVIIMGNGGSAATASHFVCDLMKSTRRLDMEDFTVLGLTDNIALITAFANDVSYDTIFAEQLYALVSPKDVVIAFSVSGNSPSVLLGIEAAKNMDAFTISFTGFDGGTLDRISDINVNIPSESYGMVEDLHLMMTHIITKILRNDNE
jgi:D-sedoheptulose 7-phosphate isomerase